MTSFAVGVLSLALAEIVYVAIVESFERRRQWNRIMFDSLRSPSEEYWGKVIEEDNTLQKNIDEKESSVLRVIYDKPSDI